MVTDHERYEELIATYTLDALSANERADVQEELLDHISGCEECGATLRSMREVAADLALAADPVAVPASLEQRVLGSVEPRAARSDVPGRRSFAVWRQVAVAAALMAVGLVGGITLQSSRTDRDARLAVALMSASSTESATLVGKDGNGLVYVSPSGEGILISRDLRRPPSGSVLKLWLMHDGTPVPSVAFTPSDDLVSLRVAPGDYDVAAVTVERDPDVRAPSSEPIYVGSLST